MFFIGFIKHATPKHLGKIYNEFRKSEPHLNLYNELVNSAKRYKNSIGTVERASHNFYQLGRGTPDMVESADHARRLAHNSFMSSLSSVVRNAAKKEIPVGDLGAAATNRHRATDLALEIASKFRTIKKG